MMMKRWIGLGFILVLILGITIPCYATSIHSERVGVLGFSGSVGEEYQQAASDKLTKILYTFGRYELVERADIDQILIEQNFQKTDLVDPASVVQVGKILGIKIAYIGNINQLSANRDRKTLVYQANAKITVKVIDVQTAKILNIIEEFGSGSDKDKKVALHSALSQCFSDRMITAIRMNIAPYSKIISVEGDKLYFINGKDIGVRKGIRYQIMRPLNINSTYDNSNEVTTNDNNITNNDNTFKRQIGLIEVEDVIDSKSQAKIIWNSEPIRKDDLLQEVNTSHGIFSFDIHSNQTTITDNPVLVFEGALGAEVPFHSSSRLNMGYSVINNKVKLMNLDFQMAWEVPVVSGSLYFSPTGSLGMAFGFQDYGTSGSCMASGFYVKGGVGLKYYLNHENGMRLELGAIGQYGPFLREWMDYSKGDTTKYITPGYPKVDISGFALQLSFGIPL